LIVTEVSDAIAIEKALHQRYTHRRQGGEWFALAPEDIAAITRELGGTP
jgi:hypothetical protein